MVDDVEQRGLDQLRLEYGRAHADKRLAGKHHRALGHGLNVAAEVEMPEQIQKALVEEVQRAQILDVALLKVQVFDVVDQLLETRGHGVAGHLGGLAVEHIEYRAVAEHVALVVAVHHGQLIEVGHHRQIAHGKITLSFLVLSRGKYITAHRLWHSAPPM